MRKFIALALFSTTLLSPAYSSARGHRGSGSSYSSGRSVRVRGYTKKNGTYVAPHHRTRQNGKKSDNWSTKGNVNPYTGADGTR